MKIFQKGKEILVELNNFYKRFITSILGILLIIFGFLYLPQIKINLMIFNYFYIHRELQKNQILYYVRTQEIQKYY